jgi:uncharacterized protein (DUF58 family)
MARLAAFLLALMASLAIAATASASPGKKFGSADASGANPVARASATAKKPAKLKIEVQNDPAGVKVSYTITCAKAGSVKSKSGSYTTTSTYDIRQLGLPMKKANSCQLSATVKFTTNPPGTGSLIVTLYYTKQK